MKKTIKAHRKEILRQWLESFQEYASSRYYLIKLESVYGIDLEKNLNALTTDQLIILSHLMASASCKAHDERRKWDRERAERKAEDQKTSTLKLVSGGQS